MNSHKAELVAMLLCCNFDKLVRVIISVPRHSKISAFGALNVIDDFKCIKFQKKGSLHAHLMLWLKDAPDKELSDNMPNYVALINSLVSLGVGSLERPRRQVHQPRLTYYKDKTKTKYRFNAPFWPMRDSRLLTPTLKHIALHLPGFSDKHIQTDHPVIRYTSFYPHIVII
ncbi:hypothetical protein HPB49_009587 [Dermacentor silvarum]|uniref:Uncharacterized protein n=1 Tax=Dermacentor silvarum TaxID=543639 RepID=A0ACB8D4E7_DERSI|nr:hypothetical protein HPB49_009587 [Dermacentor silvarum]